MSQGFDAVDDMTLGKDKGESSQEVYRVPGAFVDARLPFTPYGMSSGLGIALTSMYISSHR